MNEKSETYHERVQRTFHWPWQVIQQRHPIFERQVPVRGQSIGKLLYGVVDVNEEYCCVHYEHGKADKKGNERHI